jgi:hypothetical protein
MDPHRIGVPLAAAAVAAAGHVPVPLATLNNLHQFHDAELMTRTFTAGLETVSLQHCRSDAYVGAAQNKALLGLLLNVIYCASNSSNNTQQLYRFNQYKNTQNQNKKGRFNNEKPYDRMFLFADVLTLNTCFMLICRTQSESKLLFHQRYNHDARIGDLFYICEPDAVDSYLGLNTTQGIAIVVNPQRVFCSNVPHLYLPLIQHPPLREPQENTILYFKYNTTELFTQRQSIVTSACSGIFCDRQKSGPLHRTHACGCFAKKSNLPQVVLATDVYIPLPVNNLLQQ